ncbi:calcium-binding protein [Roseateles chitinivorans]|uniref:calcium-binding protein n=1 Tax=Roseateles chitinivorans TaxID=2917965 RepID=UPI003D6783C9
MVEVRYGRCDRGLLGEKLQPAAKYFADVAADLRSQAGRSSARVDHMKDIRQQLGALSNAANEDLQDIARRVEAGQIGSIDVMRKELSKAQALLSSADLNLAASKNIAALGRSLGTVVGAAELLYKLRNPDLKSDDFGKTGVGLIGGIAAGAIATALTVSALPAVGIGIFGKYMWQHYVAPQLGWSEKDSARFWDSVFEAIGVGQSQKTAIDHKAIEARRGTSFTRYFDDLLGGAPGTGETVGSSGLPGLKASFEQALNDDPATGLADLIDFVSLVGHDTLKAQGWDPRPLIMDGLRSGVLPAGMSPPVADGNGERVGSASADILIGTDDADAIRSGEGDDVLGGGAGADQLFGERGDDQISGGAGDDVLIGGDGDDELIGDQGADTLIGGPGNDRLRGNVGDDALIGGPGDDVLIGGSGADTFHFERNGGNDRVMDQKNLRPNRLEFGAGLALADASAIRRGNELHLSWKSGESVALARYFTRRSGRFNLHFADGASIEDAPLRQWASTIGRGAARLIDAMPLVETAPSASGAAASGRLQPLVSMSSMSPMSMLAGATA